MAQRRRPPPDLDLIEDGFVLTEEESKERRLTKQIINRRSKKVVIPPPVLSEEEFVQRCREEASNMLLGVRKKIFLEQKKNDVYLKFDSLCYELQANVPLLPVISVIGIPGKVNYQRMDVHNK